MILYSIIPAEVVFGNNSGEDSGEIREMNYMGEKVQVSPLTNNRYVIQRLISTKPRSYLDPRLQPGMVIELKV